MSWTTEVGYPETITDGEAWHYLQKALGRSDGITTVSSMRLTAKAGRVVSLAAGGVASSGVYSVNNAVADMPGLPELTSGQKYWCIVVRRTYGPTPAEHLTTYEAVEGTSAAIVPDLQRVPGSVWETPLYLVRVRAGQSLVDDIHDLRAIAETPGVYTIYDDMALDFIGYPGVQAYNANTGVLRARVYDAGSQRVWMILQTEESAARIVYNPNPGTRGPAWYEDGTWSEARRQGAGRTVQVQIVLRRIGATLVADNTTGGFTDSLMYTMKESLRPVDQVIGNAMYYSPAGVVYSCLVTMETDGRVILRQGAPGIDIIDQTQAGKISIRAQFTYLTESAG